MCCNPFKCFTCRFPRTWRPQRLSKSNVIYTSPKVRTKSQVNEKSNQQVTEQGRNTVTDFARKPHNDETLSSETSENDSECPASPHAEIEETGPTTIVDATREVEEDYKGQSTSNTNSTRRHDRQTWAGIDGCEHGYPEPDSGCQSVLRRHREMDREKERRVDAEARLAATRHERRLMDIGSGGGGTIR